MMKKPYNTWAKGLGACCVIAAAVMAIPDLAAERSGATSSDQVPTPLDDKLNDRLEARLKQPGVTAAANRMLADAVDKADAAAVVRTSDDALAQARRAFEDERFEDAELVLEELIAFHDRRVGRHQGSQSLADRARLLYAHLLSETQRPAEAARTLTGISGDVPVDDFALWLRGRALMESGQPAEAAISFEEAYKRDTTLVKPRARVEQAAALARAEQWKKAVEVLEEVLADFPDYPRRHRLLYYHARGLEELGDHQQAVRAYQRAWFEFPHKPEGQEARKQMRRLAQKGYEPEPIARDKLFDRYRQLRINKHWPLAKELFVELLEEHATEEGTSKFEHKIMMQLGLNEYIPQNLREAIVWFERLRRDYEAGHRDGIDVDAVYKYLTLAYAESGQYQEAEKTLQERARNKSAIAQKRLEADFYEDNGRYGRALELYDDIYSSWQKNGWHYTWLLYKNGKFERAYDNLRRLADRSSGQRRAKYMYWAARTLERGGNPQKAAELFGEVSSNYELDYYGIQAANRLVDIEQRRAMDETLLSHAPGVIEGGDEVTSALDEATRPADEPGKVDPAVYRDPRTVPRSVDLADEQRQASPAARCQTGEVAEDPTCRPPQSELSDEMQRRFAEALGPIRPYRDVLWGRLSYLGTSRSEDLEGRPRLAAATREGGSEQTAADAPAPPARAAVYDGDGQARRAPFHTDARIYWEGRSESPIAFVKAQQGEVLGPLPDEPSAYDTDDYRGGLDRAVEEYGELFPQLRRAQWLRDAAYHKYARWAMRDVALEFGGLFKRGRPHSKPHELSYGRWDYLIDNRHRASGLWGIDSDEKRYPVPSSSKERRELLERQKKIYEERDRLEEVMLDAMKDVGDYHLVRRATLGTGPWYRQEPDGPVRDKWMQAYPRAFPHQVLSHSLEQGLNPYLLWALMTVESSYNPDSISPADALGLLQVIPRTGIKTAQMLGDEDFGPFDLVNEDVAIEHGAFYFRNLVDKFHGQELLAIAGYNGGPHRVAAWLDKRGRDMPMDEFVEEIPFDEARGYVKKVVRFLNLYMRIYEGIDRLYIGQNMRLDYRPDPNF